MSYRTSPGGSRTPSTLPPCRIMARIASVSWISPPLPGVVLARWSKIADRKTALAGVAILHVPAAEFQFLQQFFLAGFSEEIDQFGIYVEVVFDRMLTGAGDKKHAPDAGLDQLLDDVLHDRLSADRQHLFGLAL